MREPKKIRDSAKGRNCTVRLPGCSHNPETTTYAHLAGVRYGHGMGIKTNLGAFADDYCHDVVDGRIATDLPRERIMMAFYEGILETTQILLKEGLLKYVRG